jgi:hypothetical protein
VPEQPAGVSACKKIGLLRAAALNRIIPAVPVYPAQRIARPGGFYVFFAAREAEGREAMNGYPAKNKFFVGLHLPYRNNRREFFCAAGSGTYLANGAFLPAGACRGNADEYTAVLLGAFQKHKAHFYRLNMHIIVISYQTVPLRLRFFPQSAPVKRNLSDFWNKLQSILRRNPGSQNIGKRSYPCACIAGKAPVLADSRRFTAGVLGAALLSMLRKIEPSDGCLLRRAHILLSFA